ncbi:MAG: hypothetical protein KJ732_00280 [Candidatus Margulisbacteria bacterium]|nr:hypothetical protein [Candidatus Margulisiibacteriota bacterium]
MTRGLRQIRHLNGFLIINRGKYGPIGRDCPISRKKTANPPHSVVLPRDKALFCLTGRFLKQFRRENKLVDRVLTRNKQTDEFRMLKRISLKEALQLQAFLNTALLEHGISFQLPAVAVIEVLFHNISQMINEGKEPTGRESLIFHLPFTCQTVLTGSRYSEATDPTELSVAPSEGGLRETDQFTLMVCVDSNFKIPAPPNIISQHETGVIYEVTLAS